MSTQTDKIRKALECEYQHLMGAWQMAIGPLTKADIDMRINLNRDALAALSKHSDTEVSDEEIERMLRKRRQWSEQSSTCVSVTQDLIGYGDAIRDLRDRDLLSSRLSSGEQPQQEPVAYMNESGHPVSKANYDDMAHEGQRMYSIPLYSHPTDLLMTARNPQISSSATPNEMKELVIAGNAIKERLDLFTREYGSAQDERIYDALVAAWDVAIPKDTGDTKGGRLTKAAQP